MGTVLTLIPNFSWEDHIICLHSIGKAEKIWISEENSIVFSLPGQACSMFFCLHLSLYLLFLLDEPAVTLSWVSFLPLLITQSSLKKIATIGFWAPFTQVRACLESSFDISAYPPVAAEGNWCCESDLEGKDSQGSGLLQEPPSWVRAPPSGTRSDIYWKRSVFLLEEMENFLAKCWCAKHWMTRHIWSSS